MSSTDIYFSVHMASALFFGRRELLQFNSLCVLLSHNANNLSLAAAPSVVMWHAWNLFQINSKAIKHRAFNELKKTWCFETNTTTPPWRCYSFKRNLKHHIKTRCGDTNQNTVLLDILPLDTFHSERKYNLKKKKGFTLFMLKHHIEKQEVQQKRCKRGRVRLGSTITKSLGNYSMCKDNKIRRRWKASRVLRYKCVRQDHRA